MSRPATSLLFACACAVAAASAVPPTHAQVRRCALPDGTTIYTDRSCASLGATEVAFRHRAPSTTRLYHGRCATTLRDLVYEVTTAIDMQDVNRLAAHYHWPGMSGPAANATMDRLDVIAMRPLLDLRVVTTDATPAPSPDDPFALPEVRVAPTGLRVEQLTGEKGTPVTTVFGLRRHIGCWWVRL